MRGDSTLSPRQYWLLSVAQMLFITNQLTNFPLYYLPGLRGVGGSDGKGSTKFPCSISWMTRKGLPRWSTLLLWNIGWACMLWAFINEGDLSTLVWPSDWLRALFMLQMYATGFVVVVATPMQGPDVALGQQDALHCYAALLYVADHAFALQFVLGVDVFTSAYGCSFLLCTALCGLCQFLRADGDRAARIVYLRFLSSKMLSFATFTYILEFGFMAFENALFLVFLCGMTSGIQV